MIIEWLQKKELTIDILYSCNIVSVELEVWLESLVPRKHEGSHDGWVGQAYSMADLMTRYDEQVST